MRRPCALHWRRVSAQCYFDVALAADALRVLRQQQVAVRSALTETQDRFRLRQVGDRTTLDLLNAENDAASAELTLLQARIERLMNRLRLAALAGRLEEA